MRLLAGAGLLLVLVGGCVSIDVSGVQCRKIEAGIDDLALYTSIDCGGQSQEDDENEITD